MFDPATTALGGVIGAAVALLFRDPYRDRRGRYQTGIVGFQSWIMQAILGAFIGAIITNVAIVAFLIEPVFSIVAFLLAVWGIYKTYVDPR